MIKIEILKSVQSGPNGISTIRGYFGIPGSYSSIIRSKCLVRNMSIGSSRGVRAMVTSTKVTVLNNDIC